jgi:hypothetical protein
MIKYTKRQLKKFKAWMDYNPPGSMSSKGWRLFDKEFKEKAPIRYFFDKSFKRSVILPIKWKFGHISNWIRFRTYDKYHKIDSGLKPGYYDTDTLMINVNFNLLKEFVEVEQARQTYYWSDEYKKKAGFWEKHMPYYRKFVSFRRSDLGIKHFEWAATLDDPKLPPMERSERQARDAREILILYKWWVTDRPARKEVEHPEFSDQGLGTLGSFDADFDKTAPDYVKYIESIQNSGNQEEAWHKEDEEMLIRLIKIRQGLWT